MTQKLESNLNYRQDLIKTLKEELAGPIRITQNMLPLDIRNGKVEFSSQDEYRKYYYNASGQEILQINTPLLQYSTGVIFPISERDQELREVEQEDSEENQLIENQALNDIEKISKRPLSDKENEINYADLLPSQDELKPSSFGISFYVERNYPNTILKVDLNGGVYKEIKVTVNGAKKRNWWYRIPVDLLEKKSNGIFQIPGHKERFIEEREVSIEGLSFKVVLYARTVKSIDDNRYLVTISATNNSNNDENINSKCLFQSHLEVETDSLLPYPLTNTGKLTEMNKEDLSNILLYRNIETFAIGHSCSADWSITEPAKKVMTTFIPEHETTNFTPNIKDSEGNEFSVSMLDLGGVSAGERDSLQTLTKILDSYDHWIRMKEDEAQEIDIPALREIAYEHLEECKISLKRMKKGLNVLKTDPIAFKAFQLANKAVAIQQIIGSENREGILENGVLKLTSVNSSTSIDSVFKEILKSEKKGKWRAFQIAFILLSLPSFTGDTEEREMADLIWFPTGGGKTEAYLGVAAFSMFYRRLKDPNDYGTDVIMRYTLRLLTADQFQRASRLICAMEMLRRELVVELGPKPYSIGIWIGGDTTPNSNKVAKQRLEKWENDENDNKAFIVKNCPCCGMKLGLYEEKVKGSSGGRFSKKSKAKVLGYKLEHGKNSIRIYCPDASCVFHDSLPIYVVDEEIYKHQPSFVIGTIDKFTAVSWNKNARKLFGINTNGIREVSPPNLIIQDELHLISGPLGSIAGLYETLIEQLCIDRRNRVEKKPKIISATATVRGYKEQINALYGKSEDRIKLFPSSGLTFDDSFFATIHRAKDGRPSRGKTYLGISSGMVGMQTLQVKVNSILLQKTNEFENKESYWTLLSFYNSIRELGGSLTLFQTDIPSYSLQVMKKHHLEEKRYLKKIKELTSRLSNGEVSESLNELKRSYDKGAAVDVCLASNIIEVGVDVDRLALMTVVGQPKNTAQYIQVTGRVGRDWSNRPGLVVTMYKGSVSRDKSHFEHFREYHQKLYTQVEATSVTPFSEPSLRRGLYGVFIGWLRQMFDEDIASSPKNIEYYHEELKRFKEIVLNRVNNIDPEQIGVVDNLSEEIIKHLITSKATHWAEGNDGEYFLMFSAGNKVDLSYLKTAKPVLNSMRNIDAPCEGEINNALIDLER